MSIHNLVDKIKSQLGIDNTTILYLCIIIGVGISSFGLGRLSVNDKIYKEDDIMGTETESLLSDQGGSVNKIQTIEETKGQQQREKRYVASKNGKMYYSIGCSGAKRIKPENEVWFSTKEEAEKSGYKLSLTCK